MLSITHIRASFIFLIVLPVLLNSFAFPVSLTHASHEGQPRQYYLAHWEWVQETDDQGVVEEYWAAPHRDKVVGLIDLRPLPAQAKKAVAEGYGFFSYAQQVSIPGSIYLGDNLESTLTNQQKAQIRQALNIQCPLQSDTLLDILWDILTIHADPTGQTGPKPLRGNKGKSVQLHLGGHSIIKQEPFNDEHLQRTIAIFQADYRRNKAKGVPLEVLQKWTGATMLELFGEMSDELAKTILPQEYEDDGWREPHTTLTDDFNRANQSLDASGWTEVVGNWQVISNVISLRTISNTEMQFARFDSNLSSDDHYVEVDLVKTSGGSQGGGPVARFDPSATGTPNMTGYFAFLRQNGNFALHKRVSGTATNLGSTTHAFSLPDTVRLEVTENTLEAIVNGSTLISTTDSSITGNLQTGVQGYINV